MSVTPPKPKTYPEYIEGDNAPDKKIILPVCFHCILILRKSDIDISWRFIPSSEASGMIH